MFGGLWMWEVWNDVTRSLVWNIAVIIQPLPRPGGDTELMFHSEATILKKWGSASTRPLSVTRSLLPSLCSAGPLSWSWLQGSWLRGLMMVSHGGHVVHDQDTSFPLSLCSEAASPPSSSWLQGSWLKGHMIAWWSGLTWSGLSPMVTDVVVTACTIVTH